MTRTAPALNVASARQLMRDHHSLRAPVIHGLLREGETANLIAASKRGKSWLANLIALSLAAGRPLFGRFDVQRCEVLILDNELHEETIISRLPRVAESMGLTSDEWVDRLHVQALRGNLVDLYGMQPYFEQIQPGRFGVIVLDAWYRFLPRDADENNNAAFSDLYNTLDRLAARLRCAFILVHHASKGDQSAKAVTDIGSGAGAQSRAADTHIVLRDHQQEGCVVLDAAVRSWAPIEPVCLRWRFPVWELAPGLSPVDLRRPNSGKRNRGAKAPAPRPKRWTAQRFADSFVNSTPREMKAVLAAAAQAGVPGRQASGLAALAEAEGLVHRWKLAGKTVYLANTPQPESVAEGVASSTYMRARTPHTPRETPKRSRGRA